jgi:hypothetical protein
MEVKALGFSKVKFCFGMCCPIALVNFQHVFTARMNIIEMLLGHYLPVNGGWVETNPIRASAQMKFVNALLYLHICDAPTLNGFSISEYGINITSIAIAFGSFIF